MAAMRRIWTDIEVEEFKRIYPDMKSSDVAKALNKDLKSVYNLAHSLKIRKSEQFMKTQNSGRIVGGELGVQYRFVKGQEPPNKGKKMPGIVYSKAEKTMFKKGNLPHNTRSDGEISIRKDKRGVPYRFIRISKGKWIPFSRYIYQIEIGDIPTGYVVKHKDGDTLNDSADNLKAISKRENAKENHNRDKARETMKGLYAEGKINNPMKNMADKVVAGWIAPRDPELQLRILEFPDIIELKRNQIKLKRQCKTK